MFAVVVYIRRRHLHSPLPPYPAIASCALSVFPFSSLVRSPQLNCGERMPLSRRRRLHSPSSYTFAIATVSRYRLLRT
jgi:hypothetical protein